MTIDKNKITQGTAPQSTQADPNKAPAQNITVKADPQVELVAQHMDSIRAVANNANKIIQNTDTFNKNYDTLLNNTIYQNNTLNALEVIDKGLNLKNDGSIESISRVADISTNVRSIDNIKDEIQEVSKLKDVIQTIANLEQSIIDLASITDHIIMNSAMHKEISEVSLYQNELMILHAELHKLLSVYEYLPEILKHISIIDKYLNLQATHQFKDDEFLDMLKTILNNIESIFKVSKSVDDIYKLIETLEKAPNVIEEVNQVLNTRYLEYTSNLKDTFEKLHTDLSKIATQADISIKQDLSKIHDYVLESKDLALKSREAVVDLERFKYKTEIEMRELTNKTEQVLMDNNFKLNNMLKEYEVKYLALQNETESLRNEYQAFKENIDMYVKSQIVDLLKITLEPVFKENNLTIDGLDKLLTADIPDRIGE